MRANFFPLLRTRASLNKPLKTSAGGAALRFIKAAFIHAPLSIDQVVTKGAYVTPDSMPGGFL